MPQRCRTCSHSKTREIDKLIIQGKPDTRIGEKYGIDPQSVRRHRLNHLPKKMVKAHHEKEQEHAEDLWSTLQYLLNKAVEKFDDADDEGDDKKAATFMKEARNNIKVSAQIISTAEKYKQQDEQKKESKVHQHVQKGLQTLTDAELKALTAIMAKVHSHDEDHILDPHIQRFVNHVSSNRFGDGDILNTGDGSGEGMVRTRYNGDNNEAGSETPKPRGNQERNTKTQTEDEAEEDDGLVDDLDMDLDDLDISEDNEIPSERTDPDWM